MRRSTSRRGGQPDSRIGGQSLWLAVGLLSAYPALRLSAQQLANNSGALFLLFPVGAQAVAMGQTGATLEGRGEAAFWNPAGLATIERGELALNSASLAAGATHALTVYFPSHRFGVLGAAGRRSGAEHRVQAPGEQPGPGRRSAGAPRGRRGVSHPAPRCAGDRPGRAPRRQAGGGCGQPVGELWRLRDAPGYRRRLPAVAAVARRVRVRTGRTLRAERRHGRDERVDRRGLGARVSHGLRFGRPEPDLLLLPRGVLTCAASPARCCSRPRCCRGAAGPRARCPTRARSPPPSPPPPPPPPPPRRRP